MSESDRRIATCAANRRRVVRCAANPRRLARCLPCFDGCPSGRPIAWDVTLSLVNCWAGFCRNVPGLPDNSVLTTRWDFNRTYRANRISNDPCNFTWRYNVQAFTAEGHTRDCGGEPFPIATGHVEIDVYFRMGDNVDPYGGRRGIEAAVIIGSDQTGPDTSWHGFLELPDCSAMGVAHIVPHDPIGPVGGRCANTFGNMTLVDSVNGTLTIVPVFS